VAVAVAVAVAVSMILKEVGKNGLFTSITTGAEYFSGTVLGIVCFYSMVPYHQELAGQ